MSAAVRMQRIFHKGRVHEVRDNESMCHFCDALFAYTWDEDCRRRIPPRVIDYDCHFLEWCGKCDEGRELQRDAAVARAISRAGLPEAFGACDMREVALKRVHGDEKAVRTVEQWAVSERGNLTLFGETGAGKTSLMYYAIARAIEVTEGAARFLFVSAFDLGVARRNAPLGEEAELVEEALEAESLILDDLGSEPAAHAEVLSYVISSRHEDDLETIVTTWMNADELGARYGHGVARRIRDRVTLVKLRGRK